MSRAQQVRAAVLVYALLAAGCASVQPVANRSGADLVCDTLYFGQSIPGGGEVSAAQWESFVEGTVAPLFPDGYTIADALGQWRGPSGTTHERTKMLILVHAADSRTEESIQTIITKWREEFRQESVMRVTTAARVSF